jgi:hypothetical protein
MLKKILLKLLLMALLIGSGGCDTENRLARYSELTPEDKAKQALDRKDYDEAIRLYGEILAGNGARYDLYPLLAVAEAGKAGVSVLDMVRSQISAQGGGGDILSSLSQFVPANPTDEQINYLSLAVDQLKSLPEANRTDVVVYPYAASAAFQLQLYLGAHSIMVMSKYKTTTLEGKVDRQRLEEMKDEEVSSILNNLKSMTEYAPETVDGQVVSAKVDEVLSKIDTMPGETTKEKLLNYIAGQSPAEGENKTN